MKATFTSHAVAANPKNGSQDACAVESWRDAVIAVVADGVGKAEQAGEAARRVVESFTTNFKSRPRSWSAARALEEFTRLINRTLHQESLARFGREELVSTVAVVAIEGGRLHGINVGDSRVYLWRDGALTQLSTDHAETQRDFEHVLRRAIGLAVDATPQNFETPVRAGDRVLLCSDGLSNVLDADALQSLLATQPTARTLVATAQERATPESLDDISAIVIEVIDAGSERERTLEIPGPLRAGETHDGCTLVRPLNTAERAWIARREGREVVVKFPTVRAQDDEIVRNQFAKEIWSVTRFEADFFIRAFVPPENRTLCYCMEYVQAPTLQETVQRAPIAVADALALANFLLDACQFLAGHDLVHGDLKPENILVLGDAAKARFKLIDFGSVTEVFSITSRAGTPSFLAPERFRGAPISERTEIFALGVTLFFALIGAFPYGEIEPFQTPNFGAPQRPTRLNPNLPAWLESVLLRAVAVEPDDRYQSYSEMKFDLANPANVRPWFRMDTPLLERNPLLFYKIGFFILLAINLALLFRLLRR